MNVRAIPLAENGDNPYLSYHDIGLKMPKRQPQIVNQIRIDNTMVKNKQLSTKHYTETKRFSKTNPNQKPRANSYIVISELGNMQF